MGPAEAREAALQLAPGCVRGQHLQPPHGPAGLLPVRPDADHRPPCRRHDRLCRATAPVGGRAVAGLARAVAAPIQGLRGATRGLRSYGHLGDDPPHAPSPRPPQPQAPACSVTSKTGFKFNYQTRSWQRLQYELPFIDGDYVLLTPKDILTRDENWINKGDMVRQFDQIPVAIPDNELRGQVFAYFDSVLAKPPDREPSEQERAEAVIKTYLKFPELVD